MTMEPLTLKEAAERYWFKLATLRHEARAGKLDLYKLGNQLYTTVNCMERLVGNTLRPFPIPIDKMISVPEGIYILGYDQFVKIGWSNNIRARFKQIQRGVPNDLTLYGCVIGARADETSLHHRFAEYRVRGEWFRKEGKLEAWIAGGFR
jgi:hypothetical protein